MDPHNQTVALLGIKQALGTLPSSPLPSLLALSSCCFIRWVDFLHMPQLWDQQLKLSSNKTEQVPVPAGCRILHPMGKEPMKPKDVPSRIHTPQTT